MPVNKYKMIVVRYIISLLRAHYKSPYYTNPNNTQTPLIKDKEHNKTATVLKENYTGCFRELPYFPLVTDSFSNLALIKKKEKKRTSELSYATLTKT